MHTREPLPPPGRTEQVRLAFRAPRPSPGRTGQNAVMKRVDVVENHSGQLRQLGFYGSLDSCSALSAFSSRLELETFSFGGRRSIQLSYENNLRSLQVAAFHDRQNSPAKVVLYLEFQAPGFSGQRDLNLAFAGL